jgi:hypothetical protein
MSDSNNTGSGMNCQGYKKKAPFGALTLNKVDPNLITCILISLLYRAVNKTFVQNKSPFRGLRIKTFATMHFTKVNLQLDSFVLTNTGNLD